MTSEGEAGIGLGLPLTSMEAIPEDVEAQLNAALECPLRATFSVHKNGTVTKLGDKTIVYRWGETDFTLDRGPVIYQFQGKFLKLQMKDGFYVLGPQDQPYTEVLKQKYEAATYNIKVGEQRLTVRGLMTVYQFHWGDERYAWHEDKPGAPWASGVTVRCLERSTDRVVGRIKYVDGMWRLCDIDVFDDSLQHVVVGTGMRVCQAFDDLNSNSLMDLLQ